MTMQSRQSYCAVSDCGRRIVGDMLMCKSHWFAVPKPLRDEVWRTYRHEGVLSDEYLAARAAAIEAVE